MLLLLCIPNMCHDCDVNSTYDTMPQHKTTMLILRLVGIALKETPPIKCLADPLLDFCSLFILLLVCKLQPFN